MTPEQIEKAVRKIDPEAVRKCDELVLLNPTRADKNRGSFRINVKTGAWADFATGDKGKSLKSFLAYCKKPALSAPEPKPASKPALEAAWPAAPKGDKGPSLPTTMARSELTAKWPYPNGAGRMIYAVARYDGPEGKTFRPWHYTGKEWKVGDPPRLPLPLYGLDRLAAHPDAPVLVVEGEKAADAAQQLFPDYVCVTSPHGAKSARKTFWGSLAGRSVSIWPDHDEPGMEYAEDVKKALQGFARSIRIVQVPGSFPTKWDIADEPPDGADLQVLLDRAEATTTQQRLSDYVMDIGSFQTLAIEPRDYLVHPWLATASLNMVFAPRGLGKSWFATWLARCICVEEPFFKWMVGRKGRVLLIDGEMPSVVLQQRFAFLFGKALPESLDLLTSEALWLEGHPLNLNDLHTQVRVQQMLDDLTGSGRRPDLLVFDNLSSLTSGLDENDNGALDALLGWLMSLRHKGFAVLLVHHSGKSGDQRGASRREDLLDTSIKLEEPKDTAPKEGASFTITFTKTRDQRPNPDRLTVKLSRGSSGQAEWVMVTEVSKDTLILQTIKDESPSTVRELASLIGSPPSSTNKWLQRLKEQGLVMKVDKSFVVTKKGSAQISSPNPGKYQ